MSKLVVCVKLQKFSIFEVLTRFASKSNVEISFLLIYHDLQEDLIWYIS